MASLTINLNEAAVPDLMDMVEHQGAVPPVYTVATVYEQFQKTPHEFLAVTENEQLLGVISRSHVGFLLGSRFGFAVFGRQGIGEHLLPHCLQINRQTPLLEVFEAALSRKGDSFYDDVVLVDEQQKYLGMIPVQTLVRLQTEMITEQVSLAQQQQLELQEKNRQLFQNINELRQSRGRYEILFENSALGVLLLDRLGMIETCNQRLERLLGVESLANRPGQMNLVDLVQAGEREKFRLLLQQLEMLPGTAAPSGGDFTLSLPGRGPRLFKFFVSWIQETGQICALLDDVTEQRVLERRMQQKEKSALLESLVGGIAHEINNKLSPIIGFAELIATEVRGLRPTPELEDYCLIIRDSAQESAKIIRQLLQLSRPHKVEMAPCDLRQIVRDAANLLRFRLRDLGCQMSLDLPDDECRLMADGAQLKQVVINLMMNAADAMEGQSQRKLGLRVVPSGRHFHLFVSDTGCGIKPDHVARIFDPFFTTKPQDRGTGLGLSVCFSVVRQHGGEIALAETSGDGSTFKVTLPCGELPDKPSPTRHGLPKGANSACNNRRVLIADDEDFVSGLVQETLRLKLGCRVDKAKDGAKAIERIQETDYELIISDVRMPMLDGFGLLDWMRSHRPELVGRFMFITGDAGSAELNEKLERSEVTVLRKPFDMETLLAACRQKLLAEERV
jgi:signal transduction histidine kinase/ActR/RegA family two-component response regulator